MEKRIALECGNLQKSEVINLNLDHCKSSSLSGLTKEFVSLETLSLINNGLTSLQGFPSLPKLRKLELADNFLCGGFENLEGCTSLQKINLSGNKIKDIDCLKPLRNLPNLVSLDLFSNDITSSESFPDNVKALLPNVQSFCEDELEGLSSSGAEDDLAEGDDDYEDEEEEDGDDSEGDDEQRDTSQQAAMSSSGGKSGPSSIPVNAIDPKDTNGEASDYSDEEGGSEEDSEFDDEEGGEDDEEDYEEGPGLEYLYQNHLQDNDEDDQEFDGGERREGNSSEEEDENEDGDEGGPTPAKQAKHDDHLLPPATSSEFELDEDAEQGHKDEDYLGEDVSNSSPPPEPPFDELEDHDNS